MGRASRLFPISSRKASLSSQPGANTSRESQAHLSKAERLLGTSGLQSQTQHRIPRRPSYISLTPSISEFGEDVEHDDFSSPDHFGQDPLPLRLADLEQNPSSRDHSSRRTSSHGHHSRSFTSEHSRRVKGSWSSTTLRTHHETALEQDYQSRYQPFPSERTHVDRRSTPQVLEPHYRRSSTASVDSSDRAKDDGHDLTTALPDLSRLHPRTTYTHLPAQHQSRSPRSSHAAASPRFPGAAPHSRPNTSAGSLKKVANHATRSLRSHLSVDSMKLFSRRSHAQSPSSVLQQASLPKKALSKNWWDGFPLEEDDSDAESEHDPHLATPTENRFPQNSNVMPSPRRAELAVHPPVRPENVSIPRMMPAAHEIISARSSVTVRNVQHPLSRDSRSSSRLTVNNLLETSVLSTSSSSGSDSEDPDMDDHDQVSSFRDSIAVSEIDVHHVGQAQALPMKAMWTGPDGHCSDRRPSLASISSTPTTTDSCSVKSGGQGLAYLSVPARGLRSRKSGHTRQPSSIPEDNDSSSHVASPTSPPFGTRSFSAPQGDSRKLMAVTEEEEALLEMMRRKRADKAAQRDSGMASVISSTTRSTRPYSTLSASSSILDSFPISRSQRSSLLASRAAVPQPQDSSSAPKDGESSRNRQSVATTATDGTYYSIDSRLESPTRLKYAFAPQLSLASLDVSLAGFQASQPDDTSLPSPAPLDSPATPFTRRGSAEIVICDSGTQRDSIASHAYSERIRGSEGLIREKLEAKSRRKTTSNATPSELPHIEKMPSFTKLNGHASDATSLDDDESPGLGTEDSLSSESSKRTSTISKNTSECGSACGHSGCSGNRQSGAAYGSSIGTRCSVSEDVLAAWGSLGGWRDPPSIMG